MKWTKVKAIAEIKKLIEQTHVLQGFERNSDEHIRWIAKTRRFLAEVFSEESEYFSTFASFTWSKRGSYMIGGPARPNESFNPQLGIDRVNQEAYIKELGAARGLLLAAKDELEEAKIDEVYKAKNIKSEIGIKTVEQDQLSIKRDDLLKKIHLDDKEWYEKPLGILFLTIVAGIIIIGISVYLGWN